MKISASFFVGAGGLSQHCPSAALKGAMHFLHDEAFPALPCSFNRSPSSLIGQELVCRPSAAFTDFYKQIKTLDLVIIMRNPKPREIFGE
jgi:hypothetical protein